MAFSERLKMVSSQLIKADVMADIGTDHAYVPIYAIRNNIMNKVIAADISQGSCDKSQANVNANNFSDKIDVRCGNGLSVIKADEKIDCLLISGMGGLLAIEIMEQNIKLTEGLSQLVLQPQRDIDAVRRFVHNHGFKIINEDMIFESGKYYTVLNCVRGKDEEYSDCELFFGKKLIEKKSPVLRAYCEFERNKIIKVIENIKSNSLSDNEKRKIEFEAKLKLYEEVLECL